MNKKEILEKWIPYRLQSIDTMMLAYKIRGELDFPKGIEILVNGNKICPAHANIFLNPMIEVGLIHARSLLEFLGINAKDGKLVAVKKRRRDDVGIEHYETNGVALQKVAPATALDTYKGPQADAERSLVSIFDLTNKGLAHFSSAPPNTDADLDIAHRGIRILLLNNLYDKLGIEIPDPPRAS